MVAITSKSKEVAEKKISRFDKGEGELGKVSRELKVIGRPLRLEIPDITTTQETAVQGLVDQVET